MCNPKTTYAPTSDTTRLNGMRRGALHEHNDLWEYVTRLGDKPVQWWLQGAGKQDLKVGMDGASRENENANV